MKFMYRLLRSAAIVLVLILVTQTVTAQRKLPPAQYRPHFPVAGSAYNSSTISVKNNTNETTPVNVDLYASTAGTAIYTIEFYNATTSPAQQYFFSVESAQGEYIGTIPSGTYWVIFTATTDADPRFFRVGCAQGQWAVDYLDIEDVPIGPGCNYIIIE